LGSGDGDPSNRDETEEKALLDLARPPPMQDTSSSGTPNSIQSESSTPRSDGTSNDSDSQKKQILCDDSVLHCLQEEQGEKPILSANQFPPHDRSVAGQEKPPVLRAPISTICSSFQGCAADCAPKERRRWVRPPLIGQAASNTDVKVMSDKLQPSGDYLLDDSGSIVNESNIMNSSTASSNVSVVKDEKSKSSSSSESVNNSSLPKSLETGDSTDDNVVQMSFQTSASGEQDMLSDSYAGGKSSPSSSVASHRRLEWDSGADVGYHDYQSATEGSKTSILKLSAVERLALIENTDEALRMRLDPEGTSSVPLTGNNPTPTLKTYSFALQSSIGQPSAVSTPIERASSMKPQKKSGSFGISPIINAMSVNQATSSDHPVKEPEETEEQERYTPRQRSSSVSCTKSASLLNLPTAVTDHSQYLYLYRSQSDPDVSADAGAHTDDLFSVKFSPSKITQGHGLDFQSLSSGSEKTLVHGPAGGKEKDATNMISDYISRHEIREHSILNTYKLPQSYALSSKGYTCSDNDHRHGLHHHYGILCSSCLVIPNELVPQRTSNQETSKDQEPCSNSVQSSSSSTSHSVRSDRGQPTQKLYEKASTQDRATSAIPPGDEAGEGTSAYVGKASSFEYLPGKFENPEKS